MWWVPTFIAIGLAIILAILYGAQRRRQQQRPQQYRAYYLNLIEKIEIITLELNQLAVVVPNIHDPKLLDYYESCLSLLENLLSMFQKLEPFDTDMVVINSANFLLKDCERRVKRTKQAFRQVARGKTIDMNRVYGQKKHQVPFGCYFCSRPFLYRGFSKISARLDGKVLQVFSCDLCKDELKSSKKVKVLYFLKDDQAVHWSELSEYNPIHDFWNINRKTVLMKAVKLERIYSDDDPETD